MIGFKQIVWIQSTATGILRIEQLKSFTDFIDRDDHHLQYIFQRFRKKFFPFLINRRKPLTYCLIICMYVLLGNLIRILYFRQSTSKTRLQIQI